MATRTYADTSVSGGVCDAQFRHPSEAFLSQVREGRFGLVTSVVVRQEIEPAPASVAHLFAEMADHAEIVELSEEALALQRGYLAHGVVGAKRAPDALHIALATVASCSVLVSWNFRHHVHVVKIRMYNAVNALQGYRGIATHSPAEVIYYEEEL